MATEAMGVVFSKESVNKAQKVSEFINIPTKLELGQKTYYRQQIARVAKDIVKDESQYAEFKRIVAKYTKDTNQTSDVRFKEKDFTVYYNRVKPDKIRYLSSYDEYNVFNDTSSLDISKRKKTKDIAKQLYVQWVLDAIITQHNDKVRKFKKVKKIAELKTGEKIMYEPFNVDIEKTLDSKLVRLDIYEFGDKLIHEKDLYARSDEDVYIPKKSYNKSERDLVLDYDEKGQLVRHDLKQFKSYILVFIQNMLYSLAKCGWQNAYYKVIEMIDNNMIKELYDIYNKLNIEIIWQYNTENAVDDGNGSYNTESEFVNEMNKALDAK